MGLVRKENRGTGIGFKAQDGDSGKGSRNPRDKMGVKDTGGGAVFQGQEVGIQGTGKGPKAQKGGIPGIGRKSEGKSQREKRRV